MAKKYIFVPILLCLLLLAVVIPGLYISQEKIFFYWDYGGFQGVAIHQAEDALKSSMTVLKRVIESTNLEYNYFYTIPLIPLILVFGFSRLSYILSVSLAYQLPYALVAGAIGCLLIQQRRNIVFWSAAFLCLLTPIAWAPTLRGYPDVGGVLLLTLAAWVYCTDTQLGKWWQPVAIGCLLAATILFRRHFTYDVIAFFIAMGVGGLVQFIQPKFIYKPIKTLNPRDTQSNTLDQENHKNTRNKPPSILGQKDISPHITFGSLVMKIGLSGFTCFSVMLLVGRPLLVNLFTTDYGTLFSSYTLPTDQIFRFFISSYGWVTWILVILGFSVGFYTGLLYRPVALFVILFNCISLALWTVFARQAGIHYTLHVITFVVLGLTTFGWMVCVSFKGIIRAIIISGFILFVIINLILGLVPVRLNPEMTAIRGQLFSTTYAPLIRPDYEEVIRLVAHLRSLSPEGGMIYVVDSSEHMNYDLLIKAEEALYDDQKLKVVVTPQIDSRDFYPLELMMQARYVIYTTPLQRHLSNPEEQKVVEVVYKAFTEKWEISQDFQQLPEQFNLANGAILHIYQRIHPTSTETAVRTFAMMMSFIGRKPGKQPDWIVLNSPSSATFPMQWGNVTQVSFRRPSIETTMNEMNGAEADLVLLYAESINDRAKIQGDAECSEQGDLVVPNQAKTEFRVQLFNSSGEIIQYRHEEIPLSKSEVPLLYDFYFHEPVLLVVSIQPNYQEEVCELNVEWSLTR